MKIILHIGPQKTGSTSIQETCHKIRPQLRKHGVMYPRIDGKRLHMILTVPFQAATLPRPFHNRYGSDRDAVTEWAMSLWEDLAQQVADTAPAVLILSSEHFAWIENFDLLHQTLERLFPGSPVEIISYIRHPAAAYLSFLQQHFKADSTLIFPGGAEFLSYDHLKDWQRIGTLTLRPFARSELRNNDVVQDFLHTALGDRFPVDGLEVMRENASFSAEGMQILQHYRAYAFPHDNMVFNIPTDRLMGTLSIAEKEAHAQGISLTRPTLKSPFFEAATSKAHETVIALRDHLGFTFGDPALYATPAMENPLEGYSNLHDVINIDDGALQALAALMFKHLTQNRSSLSDAEAEALQPTAVSTLQGPLNIARPLEPEDIDLLQICYEEAQVILEYGAGEATLIAAQMPDKLVIGIEHDPSRALELQTLIDSRHYPALVTIWGTSEDPAHDPASALNTIWSEPFFRPPDVVIINGPLRRAYLLEVCKQTRKPLIALVADFATHDDDQYIARFIKPTRTAARLTEFHINPRIWSPADEAFLKDIYLGNTRIV